MTNKNIQDIYPLSPMQRGILFHTLLAPDSEVYFEQLTCTLSGDLQASELESAWEQVVDRHPALRTVFIWKGLDEPRQAVRHRVTLPWQEQDWRGISATEQQERLKVYLSADRRQGFDLAKGPLMRFALIRLSDDEYQFVWSYHHLLLDGWSLAIVLQEAFICYDALCRGQSVQLGRPRPYRDYIAWLKQQNLSEAEAFWRRALKGFAAPTPLLIGRTVGHRWSSEAGDQTEQQIELSEAVTTAIQTLAQKHRLTLNTLLQGAWALLLSRYSGEKDVVFGATTSGRRPEELTGVESMVGLFINTLPVRVSVSPKDMLLPWLQDLQEQQVEMRQYEHSSLTQIHSWSELSSDLLLFESLFVFENYPVDRSAMQLHAGGLRVHDAHSFEKANYPLALVTGPGAELRLRIMYNNRRFDDPTISRMLGHLRTLLEDIAIHPEQRLADLPLLTSAERQQLLVEWNDTEARYSPDRCIHEMFEAQVERTPDAVAVVFPSTEPEQDGGQYLTYRELNRRANQLAHHLRGLGVGPETLVGLCTERSLEMVVGILGILKASGAYVPLDPTHPGKRLAFMLADSRAPVLLTQERLLENLAEHNAQMICLDTDWESIAQESDENLINQVKVDNLAYVIYTSGSTGKPKGVLISHYNVARLFEATDQWFHFDERDVWTLFHTCAFDFSVWELWGSLLYGGRLVVVPFMVTRSPKVFHDLLCRERVTILNQTPSAFRQLIWAEESLDTTRELDLRSIIFGGEALELNSLKPWYERHGDGTGHSQLVNMYGITETTVHVTYRPLAAPDLDMASGSVIGGPIPDLQVYILDEYLHPVPIGVPGEIYVGGAGLSRGYLNRPELTAERFIPNPFLAPGEGEREETRLYKSGDLGRYLPDGDIEYLGRADHQVKIRGFRIELGEIEAVLVQHPAVQEVTALTREHPSGDEQIAAYIVPHHKYASTVRRLLCLDREGQLDNWPQYELPNGMAIVHKGRNETDFMYREIFEHDSYLKHGITINAGDCIFDVGANIGLFTLLAGQKCQDIEIYAFEPIPPVFEILRINAEIYGLNAKLFNCGLSSEAKSATFTYYPHVSILSGLFADPTEEQQIVKSFLLNQQDGNENQELVDELLLDRLASERFVCQLRTISEVIRENGLEQINLLKIDVEKGELDVLAGIQSDDWGKIRQIVIEVHDADGRLGSVTSLLERQGYGVITEQDIELEGTRLYNVYAKRGSKDQSRSSEISREICTQLEPTWNSPGSLIKDVQSTLKETLPDYMVPSHFLLLDAIPLTPNGKVDRRALPTPDQIHSGAESAYVAPRTPVEKALEGIWTEVLGVERVGIHDDFFDLGGHSLLATQVISRVYKTFRVELPVRTMFEASTVAELGQAIDRAVQSKPSAAVAKVTSRKDLKEIVL